MARDSKKRQKPAKTETIESLFRRQRRMFVITASGLHFAAENDTRTDVEWLVAEGFITGTDDPRFPWMVRGFADRRGIVAYRGDNFEAMGVSLELYPCLHLFQSSLGLSDKTPVWLGARRSKSGYALEGIRGAGTLSDLLKKYIVRRMRPAAHIGALNAA